MALDTKVYWEERLRQHYDLIGVGDISLTVNYNKWSYKITRKILIRLFLKYAAGGAGEKVLDIGSGTGFVVDIWKELKKNVTGVDISTTAVSNLQKKYPGFAFLEFDIGHGLLPLPDNTFGCCSASSVLYHIVDDDALKTALENIHRVLQSDGIFIFSDNFIHDNRLDIIHQRCRTLSEYETALKKAGFEILDRVPNYVLMNDPVDAETRFYPRIWNTLTRLSRKYKWADTVIWPMLYPVELLLTRIFKESPAQEIMVCKAVK